MKSVLETSNTLQYFDSIFRDFPQFLERPDVKQEYVAQWQEEYNKLEDDMRYNIEVKNELHQRLKDLQENIKKYF